jgi:hypothetical protein
LPVLIHSNDVSWDNIPLFGFASATKKDEACLSRSAAADRSAVSGFKPKPRGALIASAALSHRFNLFVTRVIRYGQNFRRAGLRAGVEELALIWVSSKRAASFDDGMEAKITSQLQRHCRWRFFALRSD